MYLKNNKRFLFNTKLNYFLHVAANKHHIMATLAHDEASEYARELLRENENSGDEQTTIHYSWKNAIRMLLAEIQTRENENTLQSTLLKQLQKEKQELEDRIAQCEPSVRRFLLNQRHF